MNSLRRLNVICKFVKCSLLLILLATSIFFSKDVLDQYASKATSFKEYEEEITQKESVTVVVALWPLKNMNYTDNRPYQSYEQWELGVDFNLSFGVANYLSAVEKLSLKDYKMDLNLKHSSVGKVSFNKLVTTWGNYYKISANIIKIRHPFNAFVQMQINNSIQDENIPGNIFLLNSDDNSYGISMADWYDGNRQGLDIVQGYRFLELQPKKKLKMGRCSTTTSFYNCFHSELSKMEFEGCPRKCFSITTYGNATPICETVEEFRCSHEVASQLKKNSKCLPICSQISFDKVFEYQDHLKKLDVKRNVTVAFRLSKTSMKVDEEYLVQDFVGMLGSIGGTLGLFIGFSFLGGVSHILDYLQGFFERFSSSKINTGQNIINVEPINSLGMTRSNDNDLLAMIKQNEAKINALEQKMKT